MQLTRLFPVGTLIVFTVLVIFSFASDTASNVTLASQINSRIDGKKIRSSANSPSRTLSEGVLDCSTYESEDEPILPPMKAVFQVENETLLKSVDEAEYISGVWSPKGDMVLMSAPDGGIKIEEHDAAPSDDPSPLFAVGTSSLFLHSIDNDSSELIATNARKPTWSSNSDAIYYFENAELMKFDLTTRSTDKTGSSIPSTGASSLFSRPLSNGTLLAPQTPHGTFKIQDGSVSSSFEISLNETDQVLASPSSDKVVVGHGSNTYKEAFTPAKTVLYDANGDATPLLQNCQYSAAGMAWSPLGNQIAYPVHTSYPEIRVYDIESRLDKVLIRLDTFTHLGGISWSPDGKFLLFMDFDDDAVWLVDIEGDFRQKLLTSAYSVRWSPDGKRLLFKRGDSGWQISEINQK